MFLDPFGYEMSSTYGTQYVLTVLAVHEPMPSDKGRR